MNAAVALAAFTVCWIMLGALAVAVHRAARSTLPALAARPRAAVLLALALLPFIGALLVAISSFAPAIGGVIVDEHCHPNTGCTTHVPVVHADALYAAALVFVAAASAGLLCWSVTQRLRRSLRLASSLRALAEHHDRKPFEVIESREQFAYCIGLLRPKIVLSRGLMERLRPAQLDAVLRHEQAHVVRRDNLRLWLAGLALLPLPLRFKQPLLADLALAGEQACDDTAVASGGRELVISTLEALAPAARQLSHRALATFDNPPTIAARVAALRASPSYDVPIMVVRVAIVLAYAACTVAVTDLVHHGTEMLAALI